ncbi:MAG: glycosyltransferase family 1 protein [Bacteroidales bacterium]|nr:glycosyltransferase family 1 protein [Bacteroidales bacterium]
MENLHLHIIALNIPYPANYGGAIDMFYKIKSLYNNGIKIILHCFDYGRGEQPELEKYCEKVYYYHRNTSFFNNLKFYPYIVISRKNDHLLQNLLLDDYPILFEGIHTCFYLNHPQLHHRKKIVRAHNIETDYYAHLAKNEHSWWRKLYFFIESQKLKKFEQQLQYADLVLTVTEKDENFFAKFCQKVFTIPVFHTNETINIQEGHGNFILYHGDLTSNENITAAHYLVKHIFSKIDLPVVIAGLNPPKSLIKAVKPYPHIQLNSNPSVQQIDQLIQDAQINILITFQPTGLKLKLLHALFSGRFCLVNQNMLYGTQLHQLCIVADTDEMMIQKILACFHQEFSSIQIKHREEILTPLHSNQMYAQQLIQNIQALS